MFKKRIRAKEMRIKAEQDAQEIYKILNTILHHYSIGLSVFEMISYYTLAVAYGNVIGIYPDDELVHLRNKLYFSNINNGNSANRGMFGMQYDQIISSHLATLCADKNKDLLPIIENIIYENNKIFPESPKSTDRKEFVLIYNIYIEAFNFYV